MADVGDVDGAERSVGEGWAVMVTQSTQGKEKEMTSGRREGDTARSRAATVRTLGTSLTTHRRLVREHPADNGGSNQSAVCGAEAACSSPANATSHLLPTQLPTVGD
ncbi:hypothetical protein GCM10023159_28260 [Brevibacterium yomogidense]